MDPISSKDWDEPQAILRLTRGMVCGDEEAYAVFFRSYSTRLYGYLRGRFGDKGQDLEEVFQQTLVKIVRKPKRFDSEAMLWAWVCLIAKRTYYDHCRSLGRYQERLREYGLEEGPGGDSGSSERLNRLLEVMKELPIKERNLLEEFYWQGWSVRDLARRWGQTEKAMENVLSRIRKKIRDHLL